MSYAIGKYGSTFITDDHGSRMIAPGHRDPYTNEESPLGLYQDPAPVPTEGCGCSPCEVARARA